MHTTYGKVQRGDVIDGHVVSKIDRWCAEDVEMTRLYTADGGRRTECSDYPVMVQHHADPTLMDVTDRELKQGASHFASLLDWPWRSAERMTALHGLALEMNRRRAVACIARSCVCHGRGN